MYLVKLKGYETILCDFLKILVPLWKSIDPERTGANRKKTGTNRNSPERNETNRNEPERTGTIRIVIIVKKYIYLHLII